PLARPRIPSVPKYLRGIFASSAVPDSLFASSNKTSIYDFQGAKRSKKSPAATMTRNIRVFSQLRFPNKDNVQFARAVSAQDEGLLDVGGARRAGDKVDGAR